MNRLKIPGDLQLQFYVHKMVMSTLGEMKVKYYTSKDQKYNFTLMVIKGDGSNLYGREWTQYFLPQ